MDKTYAVSAHLGVTSTTGDEEGEKTPVSTQKPSKEAVEAATAQFTGEVSQVPPAFSAIKVGGKRAYQLARAGKEVKIEPRTVTIHGYKDLSYDYPELKFTVNVSSGTYIRTLVEDIGKVLGTGAYTTGLRRLTVGDYSVNNAMPVDNLDAETIYHNLQSI
jgi:tRNA pseudouridine55 synthase